MSFKPIPTLDGNQANFTGNITAGAITGSALTIDTDTLFVDSSNNRVGIGTTSPSGMLHINDDAATGTGLKVTGGGSGGPLATFTRDVGSTGTIAINSAGGDPQISLASSSNTFALGTNGSSFEISDNDTVGTNTRLIIASDGDVGIGTASPSGKLDVISNHSQLRLGDSDDSKFVLFSYSGGSLVVRNNSTSTTTNQFTLTEAGKFGIGTTSPEQKLHVYQGTAKFESTNGSDNSLQLGRSDNANLWNFNHAGNDLRIRNDGGSGYDIMFGVNAGGGTVANKVGILTASPSHQLDVNGTLRSVGDATFDANVNAAGVITTGGNTKAEVKSWLHAGRQWSFNGLPGFSKDSGATANRNDGLAPGQLNTGAAASRRALMTLIRNTYNDYGGYSGAGPDYSRAIGASIKLAFAAVGQNSSVIRLLVGSPSSVSSTTYADEDPLSNHGFGVEFRRGSGSTYEWRVFGHNGTSLSASTFTSTGITYTTDPRTVAVYSDGAGNITAYTALYGSTSYTTATTTGGPTATAGGASTYTSIQVATNDSSYVSGASAKCVFMGANFYAE